MEQLVRLIDNISDNRKSTCFAINGVWGSGKSFVLDMFEEKLLEIYIDEKKKEKYFVVRYNSWKYDYYEEPLIAIVSAIIAEIEEKTKMFPECREKQEILGMFKATGAALFSIANSMIKEKTGIDVLDAYEKVKKGEKDGAEKYEQEHAYDTYLGLNEVIDKLSELLQDIAREFTVVIIVDELDRCLPEYAIKVLERLHHLTEEKSNIITVVAVDKKQLETSVMHTFGFENPTKYLEKFFDFEIRLDNGKPSEKIGEKYADYIALFDKEKFEFEDSVEECIQEVFNDVDVRTQEHIMNKVALAHKLLYSDKKDYSFMCMEVLIAVLVFVYNISIDSFEKSIDMQSFDKVFSTAYIGSKPVFSEFFKDKFKEISFRSHRAFSDEPIIYVLPNRTSLYGAIIYTWYWLHEKNRGIIIQHTKDDVYEVISQNHVELKKFVETIYLMK